MNKNYEYTLQQNSYDCGLASLITVLLYYGIKPSRELLLSKTKQKTGGYTAYDLVKMSKAYNLNSYGVRTKLENITKLPVIAHTIKDENMYHFIVIFEINLKKQVLKIMDPAYGIKVITFSEFEKISTGVFLLFEGLKKKRAKDIRFKKVIFAIFKANKKTIIKSISLSLIFVLCSLIFNYYLKIVLENSTNTNILFLVFVIFLNIALFKNFLSFLKNRIMLSLNTKIDKEITSKVSNHILNLPYEYYNSKNTGELVTIIEDIENFKDVVTKIFILSLTDLILILMVIFYIGFLNIYLSFIILFIIIILLLLTKKYQYILNDAFLKYKTSKINYTSVLVNYLTSFETIKNLNITSKIWQKLNRSYDDSLKKNKTYVKKYYSYDFLVGLFIDFTYLFLIFISSILTIKNGFELFDIVLLSSVFYMIVGLLTNTLDSISLYKIYQTSTDRLLECLEVKRENFAKNEAISNRITKIKFNNIACKNNYKVNFSNVNLSITKGDRLFLTGKSGVGKSTLMKLLLKYFTPSIGEILINDKNINELSLSFIREEITYIGQNEELFKGTIKDNLSLVNSSNSAIKTASNISLLDKLIKNNKIDYNYLIEENGSNLSGGERQKIILTRGLLKFKSVLILDEVFNEISIDEEREILKNIFSSYPDKIIIMISHRNNNQDLFNKNYILKGEGDKHEIK